MSDPSVVVTFATPTPDGERTVELEPGETLSETFDVPVYVEVDVPEVAVDDEGMVVEVAGTTHEQDERATGPRMDKSDKKQCTNCGDRYPTAYSRCPGCGTPNQDA